MKRKLTLLAAVLTLVLCGCGWLEGTYVSVRPHEDKQNSSDQQIVQVETYAELRKALTDLVDRGAETGAISVDAFEERAIGNNMEMASRYVTKTYPLGAYAVDAISYERGFSGTEKAVAVRIQYNRNLSELRSVKEVADMTEASELITQAMDAFEAGVVMQVNDYEQIDFVQLLQDYADENPDKVMEQPEITANTYPHNGTRRVLEVKLNYQINRESLRDMQKRVQDVFASAKLYVSGDGEDNEKYDQLYSFVTERYDYQLATSITPAYSLLCHGVGDSRAFATVYGAMCHQAELECLVVAGTKDAQPWFWNMVYVDGVWYHLDLAEGTGFRKLVDEQMEGYVWDYSAYPACGMTEHAAQETTAETAGETAATEEGE